MKLDRLIGILTILLQNKKITAPELARRFEVSRRTIQRDIDSLSMAGIPITATRGGDGGIAIMDGYKISHGVLTAEEMQTLIAALKGFASVSKRSDFERVMAKIAPDNAVVSLAEGIVIDLAGFSGDSLAEKIAIIRRAINENRAIAFDYYSAKGESRREVEPYCIEFRWSAWYVFGWCRTQMDFRRFKLNRLWELALTDARFTRRAVPEERARAEDAFSEQHTMCVRFDKSARFRLIEGYGLRCYEETEDGLLLSLNYSNKDYIYGWILGFGDAAEVLSPPETRAAFAEIAKNMAKRYRT